MNSKIFNNIITGSEHKFLIDGKNVYSWGDAKKAVASITDFFKKEGLNCGDLIAVDSVKNFYTYAAILACYYNGIAFVPITFKDLEKVETIPEVISPSLYLSGDPCISASLSSVCCLKSLLDGSSSTELRLSEPVLPDKEQIAYIMHSSGSTGRPKVIPITYGNLHTYLTAVESITNLGKNAIFTQIVDLTFDLSIHDIFLSFRTEGALLPLQTSFARFAPRFINQFNANNIMLVPSFLEIMADTNIKLHSVKNLFFCGEALHRNTANKAKDILPNARIFNFYGPTEATVAISYYEVNDLNDVFSLIVPIGKALPGSNLILDDKGELLLGGAQIFSGYMGLDVKDPFCTINKDRYYSSGDICKLEYDNFNFVSRVDFQIKYRGYRVELEGIESILSNNFEGQFAVMGYNQNSQNSFSDLMIFYDNNNLNESEIVKLMPSHLLGAATKYINSIPRNNNGKIDRHILRELVT